MVRHTVPRGGEPPLPSAEGELSERYLGIIERWIPVGVEYFEEWPDRPNCGHFLGGCHWYGQETLAGALTFATAASSPSYDASATGHSREELREMALQALRYLCFTHDSGPEDCVRPDEGLGRSENFGTKWGERGKGFFRESQCGSTVAGMAITARLLGDAVDEETWSMLQDVHEDYAGRFGEMDPKSGVYYDTQMEENAWTSYGLAAVELFLANHPEVDTWRETTRRWMFSTVSTPQDRKDETVFADEQTVGELTGRTFTTLPDYMAENHGMVHPSYTSSSVTFLARLGCIYGIFDEDLPSHATHNRQAVYDRLKGMVDSSGSFHPPQGMDWPYLPADPGTVTHAAASVLLDDPDAAYFERRALETFERRQAGNDGYLYDPDLADTLHGIQDPLVMRERNIVGAAYAYLLHRLHGDGPEPTDEGAVQDRLGGTATYPHSGFAFHNHERGQTSFAWRNSVMALPLTGEGLYTVAPASDSFLGQVAVEGRGDSQELAFVDLDERQDGFAAALTMDRSGGAVRQEVLYASLPNGTSLSWERLTAREDVTVTTAEQGFLRIVNEDFPEIGANCRGERTLYTPGGSRDYPSFVSEDPDDDVVETYEDPGWLNVDDRLGIVYRGSGTTVYHNRHYFDPWWAVADDLTLSRREGPFDAAAGETVSELSAAVVPEQSHGATADQEILGLSGPDGTVGLLSDGYVVAGNFAPEARRPALTADRDALDGVPIPPGRTEIRADGVDYRFALAAESASLRRPLLTLSADGALDVIAEESGTVVARNVAGTPVSVVIDGAAEPVEVDAGATVELQGPGD